MLRTGNACALRWQISQLWGRAKDDRAGAARFRLIVEGCRLARAYLEPLFSP
jgi:hypothetical protein